MNTLFSKIESDIYCRKIEIHGSQYLNLLDFEASILQYRSGRQLNVNNKRNPLLITFKGQNTAVKKQVAWLFANNLQKEIYSINIDNLHTLQNQWSEAENCFLEPAAKGNILFIENAENLFVPGIVSKKNSANPAAVWILKIMEKLSIPLIVEFSTASIPRSITDKHAASINFDK
ncbi:MAG: hypothetical protein EOP49_16025 [Sphingobacteriales bacterium]|nr:MAG: hypothetical protein EOP49_16025 [Sphingobacteriales bacterium]